MDNNKISENVLDNKRLEIVLNDNDAPLRIGDKAPTFHAMTTQGPMKLTDFMGKWLILFSHPGDFTPIINRLKKNSSEELF